MNECEHCGEKAINLTFWEIINAMFSFGIAINIERICKKCKKAKEESEKEINEERRKKKREEQMKVKQNRKEYFEKYEFYLF